tara:strand:+ start:392 stop:643 length:252 start_codon:yes stop_codon:yes gene_type:complete
MEYYYIRNEGFLGNALIWWQMGGGYTCDIRNAKMFTWEEAKVICERPEDSAYNYKYIAQLTESQKLIVDSQYVDNKKRLWNSL